MEKFVYWIKRILHNKWRQCRSFCGMCEYYSDCKSDEENNANIGIEHEETSNAHGESGSVVI